MTQIPNKDAFKRLQQAGQLGNYFRMWNTVAGVRDAGYTGWLTVRARRASNQKLFIPAVRADEVSVNECNYLCLDNHPGRYAHCPVSDIYLQEIPAPTTGRIINFEASPGLNGWKAQADDARLYVKYALADPTNLCHSLEQRGQVLRGLAGWQLLRQTLDGDIDQLLDIWDRYPEATIEASRFSRPVGVFHSQLLIWEVREF